MRAPRSVLILGGAGLIGFEIARAVAREIEPQLLVIGGLVEREVQEALAALRAEFPHRKLEGVWGDVFLRTEDRGLPRRQLIEDPVRRGALFEDLFGDLERAYERSWLVALIRRFKPEIIVDSINTATAIGYQDVYTTSIEAREVLGRLARAIEAGDLAALAALREDALRKIEAVIVSQGIPELVRHTLLLYRAMVEAGTRLYLKIGTTGTGGMGLNIPYTHSEDRPSALLISKSAIAFAHTGLLFLMARTAGGPIVKEIKPAALVSYRRIAFQTVRRGGEPVYIYASKMVPLAEVLDLALPPEEFERRGELKVVGVDTGENGFFARGEFETITSLHQMEAVTPEEIAQAAVLEIKGSNTGVDVIAAIDGAVMPPSYRAGYLRGLVIERLKQLERETGTPSIAIGQLGPPELTKLLYEAHLLRMRYKTLTAAIEADPEEMAESLYRLVCHNKIRDVITSIGVPILTPDGRRLFRGPSLRIPEIAGQSRVRITRADVDRWARKGWVDLRPENMRLWQRRFRIMAQNIGAMVDQGSAAITRASYTSEEINIGEVVGWIFNNEERAYRIKS
jgi:NAD(P)-dependent dehydrogenase (short-subunit alcohol dehydrogenase family)